ncbi:MAG: hypothetical protein JO034_22525, partial [Singulisphaera sp.]|nr:hypothetical protein [Singulisphaera sp.]
EKPRILLVDLPEQARVRLQAAGLNVLTGTFGYPYEVKPSKNFVPVIQNHNLPAFSEQEIVVIDLTDPEPRGGPHRGLPDSLEPPLYSLRGPRTSANPRPLSAWLVAKLGDRILEHSGLFIVFARPRSATEYFTGEYIRGHYQPTEGIKADHWSFLSCLMTPYIEFIHDEGIEISLADERCAISDLLKKHLKGIRFSTIIKSSYSDTAAHGLPFFRPLLVNKYGKVVGGVLSHGGSRGAVLILPHIADKAAFLDELLHGVLPAAHPHLFPEHEGERWVHRPEYEHPVILDKLERRREIQRKADEEKATVDREIDVERGRLAFLHGLLTRTGDELVADVKSALEFVGFREVLDVDVVEKDRANKQEDLRVGDRSPTLLVEVKGLTALPREANTLQVAKFILRRVKQWNRLDVQGMTLVNHQRGILPLERDNKNVFTEIQISDALSNETGLMTTWDLFRLIRGMERWGWDPRSIQDVFYQKGRIGLRPGHYQPLGKIAHFYEKVKVGDRERSVASIQLDEGLALRVGETVGYVYPDRFEEETVGSLQVERRDVQEAEPGQKAGYITRMARSDLPDGMKVYLVGPSE